MNLADYHELSEWRLEQNILKQDQVITKSFCRHRRLASRTAMVIRYHNNILNNIYNIYYSAASTFLPVRISQKHGVCTPRCFCRCLVRFCSPLNNTKTSGCQLHHASTSRGGVLQGKSCRARTFLLTLLKRQYLCV